MHDLTDMPKSRKSSNGKAKSNKKAHARGRNRGFQKQAAVLKNSKESASGSDSNTCQKTISQRTIQKFLGQMIQQVTHNVITVIQTSPSAEKILEVVNINEHFETGFDTKRIVNLFIPHLVVGGLSRPIPGSKYYIDPVSLSKGYLKNGYMYFRDSGKILRRFQLPTDPPSFPIPQCSRMNIKNFNNAISPAVISHQSNIPKIGHVKFSNANNTNSFELAHPAFTLGIVNSSSVRPLIMTPKLRNEVPSETNSIYHFKFICSESHCSNMYRKNAAKAQQHLNKQDINIKTSTHKSTISDKTDHPYTINEGMSNDGDKCGGESKKMANITITNKASKEKVMKQSNIINKCIEMDDRKEQVHGVKNVNNDLNSSNNNNNKCTELKEVSGMTPFCKSQQDRFRQYQSGKMSMSIWGNADKNSSNIQNGMLQLRETSIFNKIPYGLFVEMCDCCEWIKKQLEANEYKLEVCFKSLK